MFSAYSTGVLGVSFGFRPNLYDIARHLFFSLEVSGLFIQVLLQAELVECLLQEDNQFVCQFVGRVDCHFCYVESICFRVPLQGTAFFTCYDEGLCSRLHLNLLVQYRVLFHAGVERQISEQQRIFFVLFPVSGSYSSLLITMLCCLALSCLCFFPDMCFCCGAQQDFIVRLRFQLFYSYMCYYLLVIVLVDL